jgi:hypothetical protein
MNPDNRFAYIMAIITFTGIIGRNPAAANRNLQRLFWRDRN